MAPHSQFRPRLLLSLVLLLAGAGGTTRAQKPNTAVSSTARVHYYNSQTRVELELALDELRLVDVASSAAMSRLPEVAKSETVNGEVSSVDVKLASPAADRQELNKRATRLKETAGARAAQAILYPAEQGRGPELRQALTRQISLKLRSGQNLSELSSRYRLKLVEEVSYSPRTYLVEAQSDGLFAALDAANALFENERVEFATPQLARLRVGRAR